MRRAALIVLLSSMFALTGCGVFRAIFGGAASGAADGAGGGGGGATPPAGSTLVETLFYVASYALAREGVGLALKKKGVPNGGP